MPRIGRLATLTFLLVTTILPLHSPAPFALAQASEVVVAEVYAGGGSASAPFAADYVVLRNRGDASVSLDSWSLQWAAAASERWRTAPLAGSLPPGGTYLIAGRADDAGTPLPTPDIESGLTLGASGGKVALVESTDLLGCGAGPTCATAPGVQDFVGYGRDATAFEGTGPAPAPGSGRALARHAGGCTDTDDNAADFDTAVATPRTATDSPTGCEIDTGTATPISMGPVRIRDIQGTAHRSPLEGQTVTGVEGVVTALRRRDGFYLQDPTPDADPATSEAVRVATDGETTVAVGDLVRVTGTVQEARASGDQTGDGLSITEIAAASDEIEVLEQDQPLPEATVLGAGGRTPPTEVVEDDARGDVEAGGAFDPAEDGLDFWESLEGMRVAVTDRVAVAPRLADTAVPVVADGGASATGLSERGALVARRMGETEDRNPERIYLDTDLLGGRGLPTTIVTGDRFPGTLEGVLDYANGRYVFFLTARPGAPVSGGLEPEVAVPAGPEELWVATLNLKNLAADDPDLTVEEDTVRFAQFGTLIAVNLAAPDLIVLQEVQDNNGTDPDPDGTAEADQTLARLVAAVEAAGGPTYASAEVPPLVGQDGGQPGANIRVAFLWRTDRGLSLVDRGAAGNAGTAAEVVEGPEGPHLSANPARVDPGNPAFRGSRKPLAGEFAYRGRTLFVVGVHLTSKLGSEAPFGRFQPPREAGARTRGRQAEVVAGLVAELRAADPGALVLVAGDFNDLPESAPVAALAGAGMTNLVTTLPPEERYTISFEGESQGIDQVLVSPALEEALVPGSVDIVHVNSEFPDPASDHDPVVARFGLGR